MGLKIHTPTGEQSVPSITYTLGGSSLSTLAEVAAEAKNNLRTLERDLLELHPHPRDYAETDYPNAEAAWTSMAVSLAHVRSYLTALQEVFHAAIYR